MLITMQIDVSYATGLLHRGITYDLPEGIAESMVIAGWGEEQEQPEPLRIVPADEHAAALRQRREGVL